MPWKTYRFPDAISPHASESLADGGAEPSQLHKTVLLCLILLLATLCAGFYFFFLMNCLYFIVSSIAKPEQTGANLFDETVFDGSARNRLPWVSHRLPAVHTLLLAYHARACAVWGVFR